MWSEPSRNAISEGGYDSQRKECAFAALDPSEMTSGAIAVVFAIVAMAMLLRPRFVRSPFWRATATPLASIIGSGFLVSAPLLRELVGYWAPVGIAVLLALSYLIGAAIRENIAYVEPLLEDGKKHRPIVQIEYLSSVALAFAYFVSVAYYLVLFASFLLKTGEISDPLPIKLVVSAILFAIGTLGYWRGFGAVEQVEVYAVSMKLAVIAGIVAALVYYDTGLVGTWSPAPLGASFDSGDIAPLLGLLIVVQGFETSRFLGSEYAAELRIRTMKAAQLIAAAIYLAFFLLVLPLYAFEVETDGVAAIVDMLVPISAILPVLVILGALASQSSAAIADANGAAGLLHDLSRRRILVPSCYPMIAVVAAIVTWQTDVLSLIALASRCFAFYYMLQCVVASISANKRGSLGHTVGYSALAILCLAVVLFGAPVEGG